MSSNANVGGIEYTATIELQEFIRGQREIETRMGQIEKQGDRLDRTMTTVAKAVAGLVTSMQLATVMTEAVNATRRYEKALADLSAITGATGDALKSIDDAAKSMAKNTTASAGEAVEAMKLIASAKPELLESKGALEEVTKEAIRLAEASGMALPAAAENLTIALNQFQESAGGAARFVDVLAAGAKYGASEIGETSIALKNAAVSANGAGLSFEETNAAIQTLAASGIKGGEAGTALRNVLLKLETETTGATRPSVDGLASALEALSGKNLSAAELTKLFGLENVNAAQAMLRSTEQMKLLTGQLTGTNTATEQAATNTKTLDAEIKRMNNALDLAAQKLGNDLAPAVTVVVDGIRTLALMFADGTIATSAMADAGVVLAGVMAGLLVRALSGYAAAAATAVIQFGYFTASAGAATVAARGFASAVALMGGPIGLAITALGLLALNWDKVSGAADNAARLVERSADRIQAALKLSGEAQTNNLRGLKSELQQQLLKAEKDASTSTSLYGGKRDQKFIDADLSKVQQLKNAIAEVDAAMASVGNYGNEGRNAPSAPPPPPNPGGGAADTNSKPQKFKFDAEAYLAGLKMANLKELDLIEAQEAEKLRRNSQLLEEQKITLQQAEEAKTAIQTRATEQREALYERERDASMAAAEQRRKEIEQAAAAEQANKDKAVGMAQGIVGAGDPVAKIQEEAAAKQAALDEALANQYLSEQLWAQATIELHAQKEEQLEALAERRKQAELANTSMMLQGASNGFGAMADIIGTFAGKQSGAYKAMFAVSKAFAIADAVMSISQGAAKAWSLGFPQGIPAAATVLSQGAGLISSIKGASFGGGRQYGGPISDGKFYRVNETGAPEMYTASTGQQYMLPNKSGKITPANKLGGGAGGGGAMPSPEIRINVPINAIPMPNGMFAIDKAELAEAVKGAARDGFFAGYRG